MGAVALLALVAGCGSSDKVILFDRQYRVGNQPALTLVQLHQRYGADATVVDGDTVVSGYQGPPVPTMIFVKTNGRYQGYVLLGGP